MIRVLAGVNGAGKSSILGAYLRKIGGDYFNPDEAARALMTASHLLAQDEANGIVWQKGFAALQRAIDEDLPYNFETTLGGQSITQELHRAVELKRDVGILFCGLNSIDLHIQRVASRVSAGGHSIPEKRIVERWQGSRKNLIQLIPLVREIQVYDNSAPLKNNRPQPVLLFHLRDKQFIKKPDESIPSWARPLAASAIQATFTYVGC